MTAKFNGKGPVASKGANKPTGQPVKGNETKIVSPYSKAKSESGTASLGSGGGNS